MKKIILMLSIFFSIALSAQTEVITITSKMSQESLDSLNYLNPTFQNGFVYFNDNTRESGKLNINTVSQKINFISPTDGQILELANDDQVYQVLIGNKMFIKIRKDYYEVVDMHSEILLCVLTKLEFVDNQKYGAFGMESSTTSISTASTYNESGSREYNLSSNINKKYKYSKEAFLVKHGKAYSITKKNLKKFFPKKSAEIDTYLKENDVNFEYIDSVRPLFLMLEE